MISVVPKIGYQSTLIFVKAIVASRRVWTLEMCREHFSHRLCSRSSDVDDAGRLLAAEVADETVAERLLLIQHVQFGVTGSQSNEHRVLVLLLQHNNRYSNNSA